MKRILLIGPLPPPYGGDTVSTANLLRSRYWSEEGYALRALNTAAGDRVRLPGERLTAADLWRGARITARAAAMIPRVDAVLVWANARFAATVAPAVVALCRLMRKPVALKLFGVLLAERLGRAAGAERLLVRRTFSACARVLPQTAELAAVLEGHGVPADRITVFPNFLPDSQLAVATGSAVGAGEGSRGPAPWRSSFEGRCVFVGQIKREKGVFDIIAGLAGSKFRCDFYGPVAGRDEREFLAALAAGGAEFVYRGILEPDEVPSVISRYDVLLFPSVHPSEGQPAVILQAFAAGVPVVASAWKAIPALLGEGERGVLVPPGEPRALADAAHALAADPRRRERVAGAARAWVEAYSERAVVRDLLIRTLVRSLTG